MASYSWASEGGQGLDFEIISKKGCFLISRGKSQSSPLLASPWKIFLGKSSTGPPGKNPSDAHGRIVTSHKPTPSTDDHDTPLRATSK